MWMSIDQTPEAIVVGSGPNGLSAAIMLAQAGHSVRVYEMKETIGGGCRTAEITLPGFFKELSPLDQFPYFWLHGASLDADLCIDAHSLLEVGNRLFSAASGMKHIGHIAM
jgi:cation diffusion facilitator CzcD-associated flavoprotein CzcO